ncbi:hypothetical protein [Ramlibacter humi]|nr:hypothetical protein [Ramlibacter humi]
MTRLRRMTSTFRLDDEMTGVCGAAASLTPRSGEVIERSEVIRHLETP